MIAKATVKKGEYHDSVALMRVAKLLSEQAGVLDSAVVMATDENKRLLRGAGLSTPDVNAAGESDLVVAVAAASAELADGFLLQAIEALKSRHRELKIGNVARSLDGALKTLPDANLALISIAGRYASAEARKALENGLHVMLFSDNVSIEQELELKQFASSRGLLLMGPDCGTAIINGVPLAFANNVNRGNIGVVAASGTGAQEVTTLISNAGAGISQAIGTGGRDVKKEIGGISFLQALDYLINDPKTEVLLLVSKPPHEAVLKNILEKVKDCKKPVIGTFLGANPELFKGSGMVATATLEEGAYKAVESALGKPVSRTSGNPRFHEVIEIEAAKLRSSQKYLRGLYTGGTFVSETLFLLQGMKGDQHTVIDFGDDEFTIGRPHPMIDFTLRNKRILEEAEKPEVAVLLLDLVLGWGAHMDPLPELLPVLLEAKRKAQAAGRYLPIVMSVTGTDQDPQNRTKVVTALRGAGVIVAPSNASAARFARGVLELSGKDSV
ncbi:MAG: hypothetical protein A2X94_01020 [Bdellovibrionales bacterium GWB1_55_8]|nr:MAG: hypothetical protein A2X94_01020 [Bdellovibrionales bacterium GWB1_55_8]